MGSIQSMFPGKFSCKIVFTPVSRTLNLKGLARPYSLERPFRFENCIKGGSNIILFRVLI